MYEFFLISLIAFIITFVIIPAYIKKCHRVDIVGEDVHKSSPPLVANYGGLTIMLGFIFGIFVALRFFPSFSEEIFAVATSILLVTLIGMIDDFYHISIRNKIFLPLLAAPPLIVIQAGVTKMFIPFFGYINFGLFYTLVLIPLAVTGAANAINMVAGYNGLEAGTGIIMSASFAVVGYLTGKTIILIFALPLLFSCMAFYLYNRYPAKIFPGDSGTYVIGVVLACCAIVGNLELVGAILFIPHFFNLIIYYFGYFKRGYEKTRRDKFASVTKEGYLRAPHKYYLPFLLISLDSKMTEKKITRLLLGIQLIFALIAVSLFV